MALNTAHPGPNTDTQKSPLLDRDDSKATKIRTDVYE